MRRELTKFWSGAAIALGIIAILLSVNQIFLLSQAFGFVFLESSFLHLFLGMCLAAAFIFFAPTKKATGSKSVGWYDVLLAFLSLGICAHFSWDGEASLLGGWMYEPPNMVIKVECVILCLLTVEALRRVSGLALLLICTFFLFYPIFAGHMPGFLEGYSFPFLRDMSFHALSPQSIIGLPLRVCATIVLGYILIGVVFMYTGGGKFFMDLALALLGRFRGAAAKVAVIGSSIFGSMSGSVIPNVLTSGSITIPAMKRAGFPARYAGAVEACASTGGVLMPPIMGAVAFIAAEFLEMPYWSIAMAAAIPSLLYYLGLFIQVDAFAARGGMGGLSPEEIPSLKKVLKEGWFYIFTLVLLVYFLYLRATAQAPFYAMLFLLAATMVRKETRLNLEGLFKLLDHGARMMAELMVIVAAIGIILGALILTGVGDSFSRELLALARGNVYLSLILGATASYILGMGMTVSACYIFLAIVLAPGLVAQGFNMLAVHLFILYWGMVSYITPPVALATYPAGSLAGEKASKIGYTSMRLGAVLYIVPFIFVLNPALVLQGSPAQIAYAVLTAVPGLALVAAGLGRYLVGIGELSLLPTILLIVLGLALTWPLGGVKIAAVIGIIITIGALFLRGKKGRR